MSSTTNRDWISRRLENKFLSPSDEYEKGVNSFLNFAQAHGMKGNKTRCPCTKCENGYFFTIEDVRYHLLSNGFTEHYKVWDQHGEKKKENKRRKRRRATEVPFDIESLLRDISGPNNNDGGSNGVNEEPPNSSASQFYKDAIDAGAPIYPGNKKYTKMTLSSKLLHFKNMAKCSEKMFDSLLGLLADVLPKDNTLPLTYYSMKTLMKKIKFGL